MKIDKDSFVKQIEYIKVLMQRIESVKKFNSIKTDIYNVIRSTIDNLQTVCYDHEDFINWYIFETNFGEKDFDVIEHGKKKNIETSESLYYWLESKYFRHKKLINVLKHELIND